MDGYGRFGRYEQGNGVVPIEWLVVDQSESEQLLLSKYGLDCRSYKLKYQETYWAKSSLRLWLNKTFLSTAFSESEQMRIRKSLVEAQPNPEYDTDPGSSPKDKIFLLSIVEAEIYFDSFLDRRCMPTPYAKQKVGNTLLTSYCWWWLRSPGSGGSRAAIVDNTGAIRLDGRLVNDGRIVVRPALRLSLK